MAALRNSEGYGVVGFPERPGNALIKASTGFKVPKVPKPTKLPTTKPVKVAKVKTPAKLY